VEVSDVSFIRRVRFYHPSNALLPMDNPSNELDVLDHYERVVPCLSDHIDKTSLGSNHYCSPRISGVRFTPKMVIIVLSQSRELSLSFVYVLRKARRRDIIPQGKCSMRRHPNVE
jgi:hypothetical protein